MSIKDIFKKVSIEKKSPKPLFLYRLPHLSETWKSDSSSGIDNHIPVVRKKTKYKLKQYCNALMQRKGGIPFYIITWLICSYVSIMSTARFKIVDRLAGFAYQLNHLDMAIMLITAQILYLGLIMAKGGLTLPWLITMFWALLTIEGPCLIEASQKFLETSILGQATFAGLAIIFCMWFQIIHPIFRLF